MSKSSAYILLIGVFFLLALGMIMLISTCVFGSGTPSDDLYHDVKRQGLWLGLGFIVCFVAARMDFHFWKRWAWPIFGVVAVLLALCYVPGIGLEKNGESRWIGQGGFQIQPSEFAKFALVILMAHWYSLYPDSGSRLVRGFIVPLGLAAVLIGLIFFEVDMGTTAIMLATLVTVMFVGGVKLRFLSTLIPAGAAGLTMMLVLKPDRWERIMAFADLEAHRSDVGLQQWTALLALGSGGAFGRGLGEGRLKMLYMPFAHTDFIFPMIGEELGVAFTLLVVLAFGLIAFAGSVIALNAPDRFGLILGIGLVSFIVYQAALNIAVTTASFPNTGLPLPFVSYGGSAMLASMAAIGVLLNIYRQSREATPDEFARLARDRDTPRV